MTDPETSGSIGFEPPQWLFDYSFTVKEAAELIGVPFDTLNHWLKSLAMMGFPVNSLRRNRRLMTGHDVYTVAILAALQQIGVQCTPKILVSVHGATHPNNVARLPFLMEAVHLIESAGDRPAAVIEVDLSTVWIEVEPKLTALIKESS